MKEKNKKLTIIVGCLLLVISVSFAYFLASTIFSGDGSSISGTAATIGSSEIVVEGSLEFNDLDILPGHKNVSSIKVTATGDNELIPYNVIWEGSNSLNTPLNYTVYKTTSEIEVTANCNKVTGNLGSSKIYYEECSISNIDALGSIISTGTIEKGNTKVTLIPDEFITSSLDGEIVYYYVILEYPNLDESQNIDMGGTFNGEITIEENEVTSDITIASIYIEEDGEYKEKNNIPSEGYTLNEEKSTCNNNATIGYDSENNRIYVSNLNTSGTECNLYYDEYNPYQAKEYILSHYNQVLTRNNFSTTIEDTTTRTIYKSLDETQYDNDGEVYYFAGNPQDNWIYFAGYYWRIIRINGDGTIRIIYSGTSTEATGTDVQIGTNTYNDTSTNNMYVGFMYTEGNVHGTGKSSAIKIKLDEWYNDNLTPHANNVDFDAGFCNDRTPSTNSSNSNGEGGTGETLTYYGAYIRLVSNKTQNFTCSNNDLFTVNSSSKGNHALQYPIGLLTADEEVYAGGVNELSNTNYYLYTGSSYWTMTPHRYPGIGTSSEIFGIALNGNFGGDHAIVNLPLGIRPVINLRANITISSGDGTSSNPYIVS